VEGIAPEGPLNPDLVAKLLPDAPASLAILRQRAKQLEQQAIQLRDLVVVVHQQRVNAELAKVLQGKEDDIDLLYAALLIAKLDNDELDVEVYRKEVDRMARDVKALLPKDADEDPKLAALKRYLFEERGFHGSRMDYYNRANSYINEVMDDREGLPITLAVLYLELARQIGLTNVAGAPVLREPAGERTLTPGDLVCFPSGHLGAHTVKGPGRFVIFSTGHDSEPWMSVYPDSDKVSGPHGLLLRSSAVGYWHGEVPEA
jgi:hypothetical protein